jgi:hypothetical protein
VEWIFGTNVRRFPVPDGTRSCCTQHVTLRRRAGKAARGRCVPGGHPELCDVCATVIRDGSELYATVPDSSAVDPRRPILDGQRRLIACGRAHLHELVEHYRNRPFDENELWAYVLVRTRRITGWEATVDDLITASGLTAEQLASAERWQELWMRWLPDSPGERRA